MSSQPKYVCTLSAEMLEKAKKELNEDPNTRNLEIKALRERVEKVPGYKGRVDDAFLLRFLRAKKFEQERAYAQVVSYYRSRRQNPEIYENLTPARVRTLLEAGVVEALKQRAPDGTRVILMRPARWDPDKAPLMDIIACLYLTMSKLIEDEETQVCGLTLINNLKDIGWHQAKHISPMYAKRAASLLQEAFPVRIKKVHIVHQPTFFDVVFAIVKQFMKEKLLSRLTRHGEKVEGLHESLPKEMLPEDLGGTLPVNSAQEWSTSLMACEAQFVDENKYGLVDMTVKAKEKSGQDATQSLGGTFRKLNVD